MTWSPESNKSTSCRHQADVVAWLQDELSVQERLAVSEHVEECPACGPAAKESLEILSVLGRGAEMRVSNRLARRVVDRCRDEVGALRRKATQRTRAAALGAAAVILFVLSLHLALDSRREEGAHSALQPDVAQARKPAAWLAARIGPDGRFDPASWRGPRAAEVGMHSLALLALTEANGEVDLDAVHRATRWLIQQQTPGGAIGAGARAGADHAMSTLALIEAWRLTGDEGVERAARDALDHLVGSQGLDGGWQPRSVGRPGANGAQTAWAVAALIRADELAWLGLEDSLAAGRRRFVADLQPGGTPQSVDLPSVRQLALGDQGQHPGTSFGELHAAAISILASTVQPH